MNSKALLLITPIFLLFFACGGDKIDRPTPVLTPEQVQQSQNQIEVPTIQAGAAASGVRHYTCPNGHEGSDAQGSCVVCGATLVHNQAWHNQPAQTPTTGEPPQNAAGVWHYTCPNGHAGGAGSAVACAECGATLVHNTVYHDTPGATDASSGIQDVAPPVTNTPPTPEPAQNADGVWHYTCPNGHEGGAGSAVACTVCGTTLVHNQFYHM